MRTLCNALFPDVSLRLIIPYQFKTNFQILYQISWFECGIPLRNRSGWGIMW